jgi:alpha-glucosidase
MPEPPLDPANALDPVPRRTGETERNRDTSRTPMQWTAEPGAGFTSGPPDATWLPLGDAATCNVADQRGDQRSTLHLVRDLIALRRARPDLRAGAYETLPAPPGAWAYRRGERTAVALNLSDRELAVEGLDGAVAVATDRARDGDRVTGALALGPWEGAVVDLA